MPASGADDPSHAWRAQMLSRFGATLLGAVLFCVLCVLTAGSATVAGLYVLEAFPLGELGDIIVIAFMVGLWFPSLWLSNWTSSKVVYAIWPKTMEAPTGQVEITGEAITSRVRGRPVESVRWGDLQQAHIVNRDGWPIGSQYWLLVGRNGTGAMIPTDATGASDLLSEMQKRLPGFDNRAFVVAMGSTSGSFQIWPAAGDEKGAD